MASWSRTKHSTKLSYTPILLKLNSHLSICIIINSAPPFCQEFFSKLLKVLRKGTGSYVSGIDVFIKGIKNIKTPEALQYNASGDGCGTRI